MKRLIYPFIVLGLMSSAYAQQRNRCDDLADRDSISDEALARCFEQLGKSPYRQQFESRLIQDDQNAADERARVVRLRDTLISQTFTQDQLNKEFFEQTVMILKVDSKYPYEEEVIFDADRVCEYLGYKKAVKIKVPDMLGEIWASDAKTVNGITIDRLGNMEDYDPFFKNHLVRPLTEITCYKTADGNKEALDLLPKLIVEKSDDRAVNRAEDNTRAVNDSSRNARPPRDDNRTYNQFTSGLTGSGSAR